MSISLSSSLSLYYIIFGNVESACFLFVRVVKCSRLRWLLHHQHHHSVENILFCVCWLIVHIKCFTFSLLFFHRNFISLIIIISYEISPFHNPCSIVEKEKKNIICICFFIFGRNFFHRQTFFFLQLINRSPNCWENLNYLKFILIQFGIAFVSSSVFWYL